MPTTPKGIYYPDDSYAVAIPADMQLLAEDVDERLVPSTGGTYTGGVTFESTVNIPTPTIGTNATTKTYVDTKFNAVDADVTALETELGSNPSGTFSTVADRLNTQDHPASTTDNTVARYDGTQGKLQTSTVVIDDNGRLTTVTGAIGGYGFVGGAVHLTGTGSPESVVSAPPGSTFLQTDSVVDVKGWIKWVKSTGTGNTGWIAGPEADTGWREISSSFTAPAGGSIMEFKVRRVGQTSLLIYLKYASSAASIQTDTLTGSLDSAFRPYGIAQAGMGDENGIRYKGFGYYNGTIKIRNETTTANAAYLQHQFTTTASWPTSLPGTAA